MKTKVDREGKSSQVACWSSFGWFIKVSCPPPCVTLCHSSKHNGIHACAAMKIQLHTAHRKSAILCIVRCYWGSCVQLTPCGGCGVLGKAPAHGRLGATKNNGEEKRKQNRTKLVWMCKTRINLLESTLKGNMWKMTDRKSEQRGGWSVLILSRGGVELAKYQVGGRGWLQRGGANTILSTLTK